MFTGLVEALCPVEKIEPDGQGGNDLWIDVPSFTRSARIGDSISINGTCLTVVAVAENQLRFQAGPETLKRTNLGALRPGDRVNLERSLRLGDRLGGHLVQGHVDGTGRIDAREKQGEWETVWFRCVPELAEQMVPKGSVTVDGVSLTVVDVESERFSVALIPHTLEHTTLGHKPVGALVNLETDVLAKYVWKCVRTGRATLDSVWRSGTPSESGPR